MTRPPKVSLAGSILGVLTSEGQRNKGARRGSDLGR